jgi:AcrR family transcriptional regulator
MARTIDKILQNRRQQQIIDAAAECFTENGFHQTGMKEICKKAGLSAGSVYHYFDNKDAIIEAIAVEFSSDTQSFIKIIEKNKNFIDGFIKATKARLKETQKYIKYGRLVVEIYAESFRNEQVKEILQVLDDDAVNALKKQIKKAITNEQITSRHDPEMLAHLLIALLEGLEDRILQNPKIKLAKLLKPFEELCRKL